MATETSSLGTETKISENLIWFAGTKISCKIADVIGEITSRQTGDRLLLEFANEIKFHSSPRSKDYLTHFLNGSGSDKTFPLTLLLEDPGVSNVIRMHFSSPMSFQKNVITIRQRQYKKTDWKNSLGTYYIYYIDIGNYRNIFGKSTRHVLAWGEDTYRWHPDDKKRFTQCLHQAASRLQNISNENIPKSSEFKIIAEDAVIDTATGLFAEYVDPEPHRLNLKSNSKKISLVPMTPQPMCRGQ